jgi:hypothetical protein
MTAKNSELKKQLKADERSIKEDIKDAQTIIKSNLKDNKAMEKILKRLQTELVSLQNKIKSI